MPLIHCPDCNAAASSAASACPHCGCPISTARVRPAASPLHFIGWSGIVLGGLGLAIAFSSAATVGEMYNIGLLNDRLMLTVMSGLVLVAGAVLVGAAHVADLLRLSRYVAGVRDGAAADGGDVARCAECGLMYPESELIPHDGALWCRTDYLGRGST